MYLLYADESGTVNDPKQIFFVLAGFSIFERQGYWLSKELDVIAARFNAIDPDSVELHGSPMFGGKKFWRGFSKESRKEAIKDSLKAFANSNISNRMFACVIRKSVINTDPVEFAFEQLASRFDYCLRRTVNTKDPQRGIIIFDKSTYESTIQKLAINFKKIGHTWDVLRTSAEVPLFLDSRASRLIQLADLIAYSIFRRYEFGDEQFYSIIANRWDKNNNDIHGLYERIKESYSKN